MVPRPLARIGPLAHLPHEPQARTVAVDAELVSRGDFAPEYSVDFQENVGDTLSVPITLDPGSWILRITLNGSRNGDTFGAHYDIGVTVTP